MSSLFDEVASPEVQGTDQKESRFGGADRKRLIILGAVGGVVVLGAGGYLLLGSGSGGNSAAPVPVVTHHHVAPRKTTASVSPSATPKAAASPTSVPTIQSALATGRDPFAPLVVAPAATTSPSASSTPSASGGTSGAGSSTAIGGATTPTGGSSASSSPSASATTASGKFVLNKLDYNQNMVWYADVTWNGTDYKPTLGSSFAGSFTFVAESNGYGSFNNGGQSFSLPVGGSKQF